MRSLRRLNNNNNIVAWLTKRTRTFNNRLHFVLFVIFLRIFFIEIPFYAVARTRRPSSATIRQATGGNRSQITLSDPTAIRVKRHRGKKKNWFSVRNQLPRKTRNVYYARLLITATVINVRNVRSSTGCSSLLKLLVVTISNAWPRYFKSEA